MVWFAGARFNATLRIPDSALEDLEIAAILEPTRSLARSYAGKAFGEIGYERLARKELDYAAKLDPSDPTPWLYSALLNRDGNRINEAVNDLEKSIELNTNRADSTVLLFVRPANGVYLEPKVLRLKGKSLVEEIVMKRLMDDQFDECPINLQEIRTVQDSLIKSLIAVYHGRVKYPSQKTA